MRVLHTISSVRPEIGGPARSVPGLCQGLLAAGVDVRLHSSDVRSACPSGFPAVRFTTGKLAFRGELAGVELLHDHGLWQSCNHRALAGARARSIQAFISPRGMLEPWSLNAKKWKKRLALWIYQRRDLRSAAILHATAESEAVQFRKLGFTQPVVISPNGVTLPSVMPDRRRRPDGKRTALFLSRIHPKKGLIELVDAWAEIKRQLSEVGERQSSPEREAISNWHFEYAGPDSEGYLAAVQRRIRELALDVDFTYLGVLDDQEKWKAYRRADLFVLPTYSENFGIAVVEALAAEVPVLTTTGTPWQSLLGRRCGWWISPGTDSLREILPAVLSSEQDTLLEMGRRGRAYAYEAFSWETIAAEMNQVYDWALNGGPAPKNVLL